jgi:hypothetical protein
MRTSYALLAGLVAGWIVLLWTLRDRIDLPIVLLAACTLIGAVLSLSEGLRKPSACANARSMRR